MKQGEREYRNMERVERQNARNKQGLDHQDLCPHAWELKLKLQAIRSHGAS